MIQCQDKITRGKGRLLHIFTFKLCHSWHMRRKTRLPAGRLGANSKPQIWCTICQHLQSFPLAAKDAAQTQVLETDSDAPCTHQQLQKPHLETHRRFVLDDWLPSEVNGREWKMAKQPRIDSMEGKGKECV